MGGPRVNTKGHTKQVCIEKLTLGEIQQECVDHYLNDCQGCRFYAGDRDGAPNICLIYQALTGAKVKFMHPVDWKTVRLRIQGGDGTELANPFSWPLGAKVDIKPHLLNVEEPAE